LTVRRTGAQLGRKSGSVSLLGDNSGVVSPSSPTSSALAPWTERAPIELADYAAGYRMKAPYRMRRVPAARGGPTAALVTASWGRWGRALPVDLAKLTANDEADVAGHDSGKLAGRLAIDPSLDHPAAPS
jgi:hypothetical protein